jgi:hypothetical protein
MPARGGEPSRACFVVPTKVLAPLDYVPSKMAAPAGLRLEVKVARATENGPGHRTKGLLRQGVGARTLTLNRVQTRQPDTRN